MSCIVRIASLLAFILSAVIDLHAQDKRNVTEPRFPSTCAVFRAPLQSSAGVPLAAPGLAAQDAESAAETVTLLDDLAHCDTGQAVELALGSDITYNAFLINPINVPAGVSLIVDGGVTVFASLDPANYQISGASASCGTATARSSDRVCSALLTFNGGTGGNANSGLYGYGVVDGQGGKTLLNSDPNSVPTTWWDLIAQKIGDKTINANSPLMISAGETKSEPANNFILYKITLRNPPFHTVNWGGDGLTVWGVKIQAPWNVPNTDGFDLHGTDATLYDTIVSNGDDDIAFATNGGRTGDITVKQFSTYGRDGISILGNGNATESPISNIRIEDVTITGDLPRVVGTTVNGVPEATLKSQYGLASYGQALLNATGDIHGLNIKYTPDAFTSTSPGSGASITNVTFRSVCMQDIQKPLNIVPQSALTTQVPVVDQITFRDIHILAPGPQFPAMNHGIPASPAAPGSLQLFFEGDPDLFYSNFTLSNVVFDDLPGSGTPLSQITATGNVLTTRRNVYPSVLNALSAPYVTPSETVPSGDTSLVLSGNTYASMTPVSNSGLAYRCPGSIPFLTGELFASQGSASATGSSTNLSWTTVPEGMSITLNAVIQPVMTQATYFMPGIYGAKPGLLAVGSPAPTNSVRFYDGFRLVGETSLSANGTLASLEIKTTRRGWHIYTAEYPSDSIYAGLRFGRVAVYVSRPGF
jgi:polygalacturonase